MAHRLITNIKVIVPSVKSESPEVEPNQTVIQYQYLLL